MRTYSILLAFVLFTLVQACSASHRITPEEDAGSEGLGPRFNIDPDNDGLNFPSSNGNANDNDSDNDETGNSVDTVDSSTPAVVTENDDAGTDDSESDSGTTVVVENDAGQQQPTDSGLDSGPPLQDAGNDASVIVDSGSDAGEEEEPCHPPKKPRKPRKPRCFCW